MTAIRQATSVAVMVTRGTFRQPLILVSIAMMPFTLFLLFWLIGGVNLSQHVLLGSMVAFTHNAGIVSLPQIYVYYKQRKLKEMFVASPMHPITYMTGLGLSRILYALPNLLIVMVAAMATGALPLHSLPVILLILAWSWLVGSLIGFTIATYFRSAMHIGVISNMVGMLLAAIPPVLYPAELLPSEGLRWAVMLVPAASAAQLVRTEVGVVSEIMPYQGPILWTILSVYLALGILLVIRGSRWREV